MNYSLRKNELVFYEVRDRIAIDHIHGHYARLYTGQYSEQEIDLLSYQLDPNRISSHLRPIKSSITTFSEAGFLKKDVIRVGQIANKKILLIDSTTFHLKFNKKITTDYIIINNGSIKSLDWLVKNFRFQRLILSTKNSWYYSQKMKDQAKSLDVKIHSLKEDGALIIPLK